jgi:hypothetical protein
VLKRLPSGGCPRRSSITFHRTAKMNLVIVKRLRAGRA